MGLAERQTDTKKKQRIKLYHFGQLKVLNCRALPFRHLSNLFLLTFCWTKGTGSSCEISLVCGIITSILKGFEVGLALFAKRRFSISWLLTKIHLFWSRVYIIWKTEIWIFFFFLEILYGNKPCLSHYNVIPLSIGFSVDEACLMFFF